MAGSCARTWQAAQRERNSNLLRKAKTKDETLVTDPRSAPRNSSSNCFALRRKAQVGAGRRARRHTSASLVHASWAVSLLHKVFFVSNFHLRLHFPTLSPLKGLAAREPTTSRALASQPHPRLTSRHPLLFSSHYLSLSLLLRLLQACTGRQPRFRASPLDQQQQQSSSRAAAAASDHKQASRYSPPSSLGRSPLSTTYLRFLPSLLLLFPFPNTRPASAPPPTTHSQHVVDQQ